QPCLPLPIGARYPALSLTQQCRRTRRSAHTANVQVDLPAAAGDHQALRIKVVEALAKMPAKTQLDPARTDKRVHDDQHILLEPQLPTVTANGRRSGEAVMRQHQAGSIYLRLQARR